MQIIITPGKVSHNSICNCIQVLCIWCGFSCKTQLANVTQNSPNKSANGYNHAEEWPIMLRFKIHLNIQNVLFRIVTLSWHTLYNYNVSLSFCMCFCIREESFCVSNKNCCRIKYAIYNMYKCVTNRQNYIIFLKTSTSKHVYFIIGSFVCVPQTEGKFYTFGENETHSI